MHRYADARCSLLSKIHHFIWAGFSPLTGCSPCSSKPDFEDDSVANVETPKEKDEQDACVTALIYVYYYIGWLTYQTAVHNTTVRKTRVWRCGVSEDAKEWEPCYELSNANLKGKFLLSLTSFLCFSGIPNRKLEGMAKFCLSHLQSGLY